MNRIRSQFRPAMPVLIVLALIAPLSHGDRIVLKSGTSKYGTIEKETDTSVTIVSEAGPTTLLRAQIKEIVRSGIKEDELESLLPSAPEHYFEIGSRYADDAEDPKIRDCARHLLLVAIDLDSDKYAIPAHLLLAQLADGQERASHLVAVLRRDPSHEMAREQLASLKSESAREQETWEDLRDDLVSAQQGRPGPLVNSLKGDSKRLADLIAPLWPNFIDDLSKLPVTDACTVCKGRGVRPCSGRRCVKGTVSCNRCKGAGSLPRTTWSIGPSGGGVHVGKELCPDCDGRARWTCTQCRGSGNNPCQACANKPKKTSNVATEVKQKLDRAVQVLGRPADSSWARELIVQDRSPCPCLATTTIDVKQLVMNRYYRRGGEWNDKP